LEAEILTLTPIAELTREELRGEKTKLADYRAWFEREGRRHIKSLGLVSFEPDLPENAMLTFKYLQAVYSLRMFYGRRVETAGYFESANERVCAAVMIRGGSIADMYADGAEALYAALLSDPFTDKAVLQKTIDRHIPF
jgi:hypothetical protein